jgi:uncharacterized protein
MKFQPDTLQAQSITGYGDNWVSVNNVQHKHSLVISAAGAFQDWSCAHFEDLTEQHFSRLLALAPELVLFGSGAKLRFPKPEWLTALYAQRIGVETMDTQAACRTYNFLAGEGRRVVAALLL